MYTGWNLVMPLHMHIEVHIPGERYTGWNHNLMLHWLCMSIVL